MVMAVVHALIVIVVVCVQLGVCLVALVSVALIVQVIGMLAM